MVAVSCRSRGFQGARRLEAPRLRRHSALATLSAAPLSPTLDPALPWSKFTAKIVNPCQPSWPTTLPEASRVHDLHPNGCSVPPPIPPRAQGRQGQAGGYRHPIPPLEMCAPMWQPLLARSSGTRQGGSKQNCLLCAARNFARFRYSNRSNAIITVWPTKSARPPFDARNSVCVDWRPAFPCPKMRPSP
jgi:hypothetical protein